MIDSEWYQDITSFAQSVTWLAKPVELFTEYGLLVCVPLFAWLLWQARRQGNAALAKVLWIPIAVAIGYVISSVIKSAVSEARPCRALTQVHTLLPCNGPTDFAFPSNHTVIAFSFAAAVLLVNRRWGVLALVFALFMGISRIYVGAHYPHDVLAGLIIGCVVGLCGILAFTPLKAVLDRIIRGGNATQLES
jgi:undecaprenyl-diphosphatase